mgnify:CR=1 FL=1
MQKKNFNKECIKEIVDADHTLFTCYQGRRSDVEYLRDFRAHEDTINESGGEAGYSLPAARIVAREKGLNYDAALPEKKKEIMGESRSRFVSMLFVKNLDGRSHFQMKKDIHKDYVRNKKDLSPQSYTAAMLSLIHI